MATVQDILEQKSADELVKELSKAYGYGHLIALIRKAWAEDLIKTYGLSAENAIKFTNVEPYAIKE